MSNERVINLQMKPIIPNRAIRANRMSKLYQYRYDTKYTIEIQVDNEKDGSNTISTWVSMEGKFTKVCLMTEKSRDIRGELDTLVKKSFEKMEEMYPTVDKWFSV